MNMTRGTILVAQWLSPPSLPPSLPPFLLAFRGRLRKGVSSSSLSYCDMMFSFLCGRAIAFPNPIARYGLLHNNNNNTFLVCFLQNALSKSTLRPCSSDISTKNSSVVEFQSETVIKPSQKKKKLEKAEQVDALLRSYGFLDAHISKLQTLRPRALTLNPHKVLLPKFEFLLSIGVSPVDLPKIITLNPSILESSLDKRLIPSYNYLKSLHLRDEDIVRMIKNYWKFFQTDEEKIIGPKIEVLKSLGVPQPAIALMLVHYTSVLHLSLDTFKRGVAKATQMGFDPSVGLFVQAVKALSRFDEGHIEQVKEIYRRRGFSDDEILLVFRSQPLCMDSSEKKITRTMDFLINEMKWKLAAVVRWPTVLRYNLEKRIIPRCRVIKLLIANNLVEENISFGTFISVSEQLFLDRYVHNCVRVLPELIGVYRGEMDSPSKLEPELGD